MKNRICAAAAASLLVVLATSPVPASAAGADVAPAAAFATPAATASPDWLTEINAYRTASGLNPVTNQPIWEQGLRNHFTYLTNTPKSYFTGDYENVHIENPQSPYYTADGAQEGARSNLTSSSVPTTPVQDIDGWLAAPFHAIGMLRPNLTQVAYASDPGHLNAGLDTSGQDSSMPARTTPVLFPGPDMTTNLTRYNGGEVPDLMETCGPGFSASPGLPLILLLPGAPSKDLAASVSGPDGSVQSTGNGQLCVVDENTFRTSDTVYGSTGLQILQGDHAVLLITKLPYAVGRNTVGVSQTGSAPISWAFTVSPTGPVTATSSTTTLHVATGAQTVVANLTVTNPSGTGFTTVYPCSEVRPLASTNNYTAGQTTPNAVAVRSDDAGNVCIFTSATADLIWDQVSESDTLPAHSPTRLLDTRGS